MGDSKIVEVPGLVVIRCVGTGGLSDLWAAELNALGQRAGSGSVKTSIPRYSKVSAAGVLGISRDFGGSGVGFRVSLDYLPIFIAPTRNNKRSLRDLPNPRRTPP